MPGLLSDIDPDGLLEFSVVFTDRSVNHMSQKFQQVMNDISSTLKRVYNAEAVAVVPGGGTYGMEAVARQFATGKKCLVMRNGFFSFRWTQILEMGSIASVHTVLKASRTSDVADAPFAPRAVDDAPPHRRRRPSRSRRLDRRLRRSGRALLGRGGRRARLGLRQVPDGGGDHRRASQAHGRDPCPDGA